MIATLTGTVSHIGLDSLVLEVHGVGYLVRTTPEALAHARHGMALTLHTELVVREDSLTLFGFPSARDADAFRVVQSVSGIGPRIALAVLAVLSPDDLARAVAAQDVKAITRTPGVGPKVASRMILELGGKLAAPQGPAPAETAGTAAAPPGESGPASPADGVDAQVLEALVGLGWPEKAAGEAVAAARSALQGEDGADAASAEAAADLEPGILLRTALRGLGGSR